MKRFLSVSAAISLAANSSSFFHTRGKLSKACPQKEFYLSLLLLLIHIILFLAIKRNRETADPKLDFPANLAKKDLKA